jgi:F-type H+-transporting ATPase subunit b
MEKLGIEPKLLLAQIVNFILFFILVKKFIVKPFIQFLDQEKKKEKEKEDALTKIKKSEEQLTEQERKLKDKAKRELDAILIEAKKDGQQIRADILKQAEIDAEEIKTRMKKQLDEERERLYKDIREKIADVSLYLVNEGLKEALDVETKRKITERILRNLSTTKIIEN